MGPIPGTLHHHLSTQCLSNGGHVALLIPPFHRPTRVKKTSTVQTSLWH